MANATPKHEQYISPNDLYTVSAFFARSGCTATRRSEARRAGIELPVLSIGKRRLVRGVEGIRYLEKLAARED